MVALSGRIRLLESCTREAEAVVRELYEDGFGPEPEPEQPDPGDTEDGGAPGER
jgi:MoxR-like ATPase